MKTAMSGFEESSGEDIGGVFHRVKILQPETNDTVTTENSSLGPVDIFVVILYFIITVGVGLWATYSGSRKSLKGYFLAGGSMKWLPVGASLFASNIGTGHFIGLAGTGAASGIAIGSFEWLAPYLLIELGWVFLPIYISCKVYTMPEYLHKRFGGRRLRITMSIIAMLLYVLTKIAVDLYAGALFIQMALDINLYVAIVSLLVVTAIYTVLGGLKAVIYTDTLQTAIMIIGGVILMILSFIEIGGYGQLENLYMNSVPQTTLDSWTTENSTDCGKPRPDSFHIFRDPIDSDLPWPGMLSAIYLLGSWYWCTDQVIVQRTLASASMVDAKGGCLLAGFLKIIPMYIIVITGMVSRVLFPDEVACVQREECEKICQNPEGCSNIAYPKLVLEILPTGLRGIMVAAMLSALMSSLTSIFNSTSTIFTIDIWKRIRKQAAEKEQLIVGKVTVILLVVVSILWIPVLLTSAGGQLFIYLQSIQSALGPPIFALYLYGILWPRINEKGAFWGLITGFSIGITRLILDFSYRVPSCGEPEYRPPIIYKVNYLYVSPIVFAASSIVTAVVSYLTEPPNDQQLNATTWSSLRKLKKERMRNENGKGIDTKARNSIPDDLKEENSANDERVKMSDENEHDNHESIPLQDLKKDNSKTDYEVNDDNDITTADEESPLRNTTNAVEVDEEKGNPDSQIQLEDVVKKSYLGNIEEDSRWKLRLNVIAIALAILTTFLMGVYA